MSPTRAAYRQVEAALPGYEHHREADAYERKPAHKPYEPDNFARFIED